MGLVGVGLAAKGPWACDSGQPAEVDGVKYKTKVALVMDGYPETPSVSVNGTMVKVEVQAWVAATNAPFRFQFPNPYEFTLPPKNDGTIVGFDVGLAPVPGHPMTKHSVRMLC